MAENQSAVETADVAPLSSRATCAARISWMTRPDWEVRVCALPHGHRGDHRCAAGYRWNDGRWLD
jgi:hypothetical protein